MLPDPLHPAVVHLPLALAILVPVLAFLAILAVQRAWLPPRVWVAVVILQALLAGSAWFAEETGHDQEERVEKIVGEDPIETHEEAAERLVTLAACVLALTAAGLAPGRIGRMSRWASGLASLAVLAAGISVGHSGGELVYRYGAASAYVETGANRSSQALTPAADRRQSAGHSDDHDDHDDDDD